MGTVYVKIIVDVDIWNTKRFIHSGVTCWCLCTKVYILYLHVFALFISIAILRKIPFGPGLDMYILHHLICSLCLFWRLKLCMWPAAATCSPALPATSKPGKHGKTLERWKMIRFHKRFQAPWHILINQSILNLKSRRRRRERVLFFSYWTECTELHPGRL